MGCEDKVEGQRISKVGCDIRRVVGGSIFYQELIKREDMNRDHFLNLLGG